MDAGNGELISSSICITSNRPVDNSRFLAHLQRRLKRIHPERIVTLYRISELVRKIMAITPEQFEDPIVTVLTEELGLREDKRCELLLDAFEELNSSDEIGLADTIIRTIRAQFKSTRVWASAYSKYDWYLEDKLGQIKCYKLEPLRPNDLLGFLVSLWAHNQTEFLDHGRLNQFANGIWENFQSVYDCDRKSSSELGELFDSALLIRMLADIYENDAIEYARLDNGTSTSALDFLNFNESPSGMGEYYKNWIGLKFERYLESVSGGDNDAKLNGSELLTMHTRLSLDFLFPGQFQELKEALGPISIDEMLKVGIFRETDRSPRTLEPMDPSITDYFIATFISEKLGEDLTEFLLDCALATQPKLIYRARDYTGYSFNSFTFKRPAIAYFLNQFLKADSSATSRSPIAFQNTGTSNFMRQLAHSCVISDSYYIFQYFDQLGAFENNPSSIFDNELVLLAVEESGMHMVKVAFARFRKFHSEIDEDDNKRILRMGIWRAEYSIFKYLLEDTQLHQMVHELRPSVKYLLHDCVHASRDYPEWEIDERIKVMGVLVGINKKLLEEWNPDGNTPLHAEDIHVRLQIELMRLGADVLSQGQSLYQRNKSVLHLDWSPHMSAKDYHSLVMSIGEEKLKILVRLKNEDGETPLWNLIRNMNPKPKTLERFKEVGALFEFEEADRDPECDFYDGGCSLLGYANYCGRSVATIKQLIQLGGNVTLKGRGGRTFLHSAAEIGRSDVVRMLIDEGLIDVNVEDAYGSTPLDVAIQSRGELHNRWDSDSKGYVYGDCYKTGMLLHENGGRFRNGQEQLLSAVKDMHPPSVKLLLDLGVDGNSVDEEGNTPFHIVMGLQRHSDYFMITRLLLDNHVNLNVTNKMGEPPLEVGIKKSRVDYETLQLLRNVTEMTWTGELATLGLFNLMRNGNADGFTALAQELVDHGADLDYMEKDVNYVPCSLLHFAVKFGNERAVPFLVKRGADVNLANARGFTPLHEATADTGLEIIKFLINNGADANARNIWNETFLHLYTRWTYPSYIAPNPDQFHSLVIFLVEKNLGNLFNSKDGFPRATTPYQYAQEYVKPFKKTLALLHSVGVPDEVSPKIKHDQ